MYHRCDTWLRTLENVRSTTSAAPQPSYTDRSIDSSLDSFEPVDATTVQRLISNAANKTCELDPARDWWEGSKTS